MQHKRLGQKKTHCARGRQADGALRDPAVHDVRHVPALLLVARDLDPRRRGDHAFARHLVPERVYGRALRKGIQDDPVLQNDAQQLDHDECGRGNQLVFRFACGVRLFQDQVFGTQGDLQHSAQLHDDPRRYHAHSHLLRAAAFPACGRQQLLRTGRHRVLR